MGQCRVSTAASAPGTWTNPAASSPQILHLMLSPSHSICTQTPSGSVVCVEAPLALGSKCKCCSWGLCHPRVSLSSPLSQPFASLHVHPTTEGLKFRKSPSRQREDSWRRRFKYLIVSTRVFVSSGQSRGLQSLPSQGKVLPGCSPQRGLSSALEWIC